MKINKNKNNNYIFKITFSMILIKKLKRFLKHKMNIKYHIMKLVNKFSYIYFKSLKVRI
jgi:hypothetical protein